MNWLHAVAGFGNPLLDMSVIIKGNINQLLSKYNLEPDGQKEVDDEEFKDILTSIEKQNCDIYKSPGGCVLNTLRIIQALTENPSVCVFFGGLGNDKEGQLLETEVRKCGIEARFAKHSSSPSGKVIALVNKENRSLVAHIGAAKHYSLEDFNTEENKKILEEVSVIYIEGFFITHSFEVALEIARLCKINGVVLILNISGAYVAESYPNELLAVASSSDFVIGNASEFKALAKIMDLNFDDLTDLAKKVHSNLWGDDSAIKYKLKQMKYFGKTVIITQGKSPVHYVYGNGIMATCDVPSLDPKLVIDPTGAGDAFAAGFIIGLLQNGLIGRCLLYGCKIAQEVIKNTGVQLGKLNVCF